jgi:outer membrane protein OmpA-like peptidoglycan-associated protein/tetratricopeptide (TPR) repeat protein
MVLIMKRISTIIIMCCLVSIAFTDALGQNVKLRYADRQLELSNLTEAAEGYEEAFEKKATYRAAKGAAIAYERLSSYQQAYKWWKSVVDFEEATPDDFANYVYAVHQGGSFEELKAAVEKNKGLVSQANFNMDSLLLWYSNSKNVELISLDSLNSPATDYGLAFDQKGNRYFSSDRGPVSSSGKKSIRVDGSNQFDTERYDMTGRNFISIYKEDEKKRLVPLESIVPDTYHFADPWFMKQSPILFYTVTRDQGKIKKKRNYNIYPEIYYSTVNDNGELTDFQSFPINSALEHGVITPFVDEVERKIYFSSNRSGGLGGYDLYYVTYDDDFAFSAAVNLGPSVNTPGDERDPFMLGDSFYFSSNGHVGLGGLDVFHASYREGTFSSVHNLGLPYNSPQDDFAMQRNAKGETFLSSNRMSGAGLDDMYKIEDLYRRFIGKVFDCDGNLVIDNLDVTLNQKDGNITVPTRQEEKGVILADLSPETDFQLTLKKQGYFTLKDNLISIKGMTGEKLEKEYHLKKIPYNTVVSEDLIYYNFDESQLRSDATPILERVAEHMKNHTFLEILVRSHADSRASNEYNEALSERRANAVREFLGDYGIARARVKSEWFGEEQLTNDCGDGVPCPESAHQLNRRSEIILRAFPDENKTYEYPKELEGIDVSQLKDLKLPAGCL